MLEQTRLNTCKNFASERWYIFSIVGIADVGDAIAVTALTAATAAAATVHGVFVPLYSYSFLFFCFVWWVWQIKFQATNTKSRLLFSFENERAFVRESERVKGREREVCVCVADGWLCGFVWVFICMLHNAIFICFNIHTASFCSLLPRFELCSPPSQSTSSSVIVFRKNSTMLEFNTQRVNDLHRYMCCSFPLPRCHSIPFFTNILSHANKCRMA